MQPARPCACAGPGRGAAGRARHPPPLPGRHLRSFWEWWKIQHSREKIGASLAQVTSCWSTPQPAPPCPRTCAPSWTSSSTSAAPSRSPTANRPGATSSRPRSPRATAPSSTGRARTGTPPISGGSTGLRAAAAARWRPRCSRPGRAHPAAGPLRVGAGLHPGTADTYYDSRSFTNTDFMSERDRMAPLLARPSWCWTISTAWTATSAWCGPWPSCWTTATASSCPRSSPLPLDGDPAGRGQGDLSPAAPGRPEPLPAAGHGQAGGAAPDPGAAAGKLMGRGAPPRPPGAPPAPAGVALGGPRRAHRRAGPGGPAGGAAPGPHEPPAHGQSGGARQHRGGRRPAGAALARRRGHPGRTWRPGRPGPSIWWRSSSPGRGCP